jgi:hypothetical protein
MVVLTETCKGWKIKSTTFNNHTGRWLKSYIQLLVWRARMNQVKFDKTSLSWARWIQSTLSYPVSFTSLLMLFSHYDRVLQVVSSFKFPDWNLVSISNFSHARCILMLFGEDYGLWSIFVMQFSPASCYFFSLMSRYSPQHPVLLTRTVSVSLLVSKTEFCTA